MYANILSVKFRAFFLLLIGVLFTLLLPVKVFASEYKNIRFEDVINVGGDSNDSAESVFVDSSGNIYITGTFQGTVDFDPSSSTDNHTSNGGDDIFVSKYSSNKTYLWTKTFGGTSSERVKKIVGDSSGVYIIGSFSGTVDFDPSASTDNHTSNGSYDVYLLKLDLDGNYSYVKTFGGTSSDYGNDIVLANDALFLIGSFEGSVDFDPSSGTDMRSSNGGSDIFIAKYQTDGTYLWVRTIGDTDTDSPYAIDKDTNSNIYITGNFSETVDFDPSSAVASYTSNGDKDVFILKLDKDGNYIYTKVFGGVNKDVAYDISVSGNLLSVVGMFSSKVDFDPSNNADEKFIVDPTRSYFISVYDLSGNYKWSRVLGSQDYEMYNRVISYNNAVYVYGVSSSDFKFIYNDVLYRKIFDNSIGAYILNFDADGGFQWVNYIDGTVFDTDIYFSNAKFFITGKFSGSVDFDFGKEESILPSKNNSYDAFLMTISENTAPKLSTNKSKKVFRTKNPYVYAYVDSSINHDNINVNVKVRETFSSNSCAYLKEVGSVKTYLCQVSDSLPDGSYTLEVTANDTINKVYSNQEVIDIRVDSTEAPGLYCNGTKFLNTEVSSGHSNGAYGISITENSVYTTGYFYGTADFDSSSSSADYTSNGYEDVFLLKYDKNGNYKWAKTFGGTGYDLGEYVYSDDEFVYVTGYYRNTVDFDTSSGIDEYTSNGGTDVFLTKYGDNGNYVWTKAIGGTSDDVGKVISLDKDKNVYVAGKFKDTVDFDPSAGVDNKISNGGYDAFMSKYTKDGTYLYTITIGGSYDDYINDIKVGGDYIYILGTFNGTVDFDPTSGVDNKTSNGYDDVFISKYKLDGTYVYTKTFGGSESDNGSSLLLSDDNIFVVGEFKDTVDFDPSSNVSSYSSEGARDIYISKYTLDGEYVTTFTIGEIGDDYVVSASINILNDQIVLYGKFSNDLVFNTVSGEVTLNSKIYNKFFAMLDYGGKFNYVNYGTNYEVLDMATYANEVYLTGRFNSTVDFCFNEENDFNSVGSYNTFWSKYVLDQTASSINVKNLELNPPYRDQTEYTLTGTLSENLGIIFGLQFQLDDNSIWVDCTADDGEFNDKNEDFTCVISGLDDGIHTVNLRSYDSNGNYTAIGEYPIVNYKVDTTPPSNNVENTDYEIVKISGKRIQDSFKNKNDYRKVLSEKNKPTIEFEKIADVPSGIVNYEVRITETDKLGRKKGNDYSYIYDIPPNSPTDTNKRERDGVVIKYNGDYIKVEPKDNRYKLKEGRYYYVKIRAYDEAGNFVDSAEVKIKVSNEEHDKTESSANFTLTNIGNINYIPSIDDYYYTSSQFAFKGKSDTDGTITIYVDGNKIVNTNIESGYFEIPVKISHGAHKVIIQSGDNVVNFNLSIGIENIPSYILEKY